MRHINARFGVLFPGVIVRGTAVLPEFVCLCIHHPVMVDEETIIVALLCEEKERRQRRKVRDVSGFTTYGEHAKPMENS
jgi:hypothetical protein